MKALVLFLLLAILPVLRADDAIFFGNSFTNHIPAIVSDIAKSKGKELATQGVIKNGMGLDAHLTGHGADDALKSKAWTTVILQDYSLNATHARDPRNFMRYGDLFYDKIAQEAPTASIVLYETWAYNAQHRFITGAGDPKAKAEDAANPPPATDGNAMAPVTPGTPAALATTEEPDPKFASADEMYTEIHNNCAALQSALQARDAKRKVLVAPVGTAFANCIKDHPNISLYTKDLKHPNADGDYLAACVLYATITGDSPLGAASSDGVPDADAKVLQTIAAATALKK